MEIALIIIAIEIIAWVVGFSYYYRTLDKGEVK